MQSVSNAEIVDAWSRVPAGVVARFGDRGDFARQHLLTPAILRLLGTVAGQQILDAGCGQGYLCRMLARQGAVVTGVEPARPWFEYASQREQQEPLGISYIQADLSTFDDLHTSFDAVVANMVFMDIPDYQTAMRNCIRCLKPDGKFIFSISHPCFEGSDAEYAQTGGITTQEYFQEYAIQQLYGVRFHRPLSHYLNFIIQARCTIQALVEPQLEANVANKGTEHARNLHIPAFLIVHARKM